MDVSRFAFTVSVGMVSGPHAFPFFSFSITFLISFLVGFSMLIGRGVSAGGMSGEGGGGGEGRQVLVGLSVQRSALSIC